MVPPAWLLVEPELLPLVLPLVPPLVEPEPLVPA